MQNLKPEVSSKVVSSYELDLMSKCLTQFGGTLVEIVDGKKIVVDFEDVDKMLVIIDALKRESKRYAFNSRVLKDGVHRCEIFAGGAK